MRKTHGNYPGFARLISSSFFDMPQSLFAGVTDCVNEINILFVKGDGFVTLEELKRGLRSGFVIRCPTDEDRVSLVNAMVESGEFIVSSRSRIAEPVTSYPYILHTHEIVDGKMILSGSSSERPVGIPYEDVCDLLLEGEPLDFPTGEELSAALDALLS